MNFKVYIIILNWNGWKDTIECLESVFRNTYSNYQVIVCDNNSSDGSLERIKEWADGKLMAGNSSNATIYQNTNPPINKPIQCITYICQEIENSQMVKHETPLTLIQTGKNLGFAGGNNIGIQYVLQRNDFSHIWLLNNDTVIQSDALEKLVQYSKLNLNMGICGSRLLYYDNPEKVQALGGIYNRILGISKHITKEKNLGKINYVVGASTLVSREFLQKIGLMDERYFLYYEELDWAMRSRGKYELGCAVKSIVYHKEGASIGGGQVENNKSEIADYYSIRNRIMFTKKYFRKYLLFVYLGLLVTIFNRVRRRQYKRIKMIFKIIWNT